MADMTAGLGSAAVMGATGLIVVRDFLPHTLRNDIVRVTVESGMAAMSERRAFVGAGGLMAYGASFPVRFCRAAPYAHIRDTVCCDEMGNVQVRGIGHAIAAYRGVDLYGALTDSDEGHSVALPHVRLEIDPGRMSEQDRVEAASVLRKTLVRLEHSQDSSADLE